LLSRVTKKLMARYEVINPILDNTLQLQAQTLLRQNQLMTSLMTLANNLDGSNTDPQEDGHAFTDIYCGMDVEDDL